MARVGLKSNKEQKAFISLARDHVAVASDRLPSTPPPKNSTERILIATCHKAGIAAKIACTTRHIHKYVSPSPSAERFPFK